MQKQGNTDYKKLNAFWDSAFSAKKEQKLMADETDSAEALKAMAPSEKLFTAAHSLGEKRRVLDYGCGSGWAGIIAAKGGCKEVLCVDAAKNAVDMTARNAERFAVSTDVNTLHIAEDWLSQQPAGSFDGFFCSNVLDVVPPKMSEEIITQAARITNAEASIIIGLNYYLRPDAERNAALECRNGNQYYVDGILRLVSRTDEDWAALFEKYFTVDRLEHFAWPGEEKETRRLFYLIKNH